MKRILTTILILLSSSTFAYASHYNECHCKYGGISGDYEVTLYKMDLGNNVLFTNKMGAFHAQNQCLNFALTTPACNQRTDDTTRYCQCKYNGISGDYKLTSYLLNKEGKLIRQRVLAEFFGNSQCTQAAGYIAACL